MCAKVIYTFSQKCVNAIRPKNFHLRILDEKQKIINRHSFEHHVFTISRKKPYEIFSLKKIVNENNVFKENENSSIIQNLS